MKNKAEQRTWCIRAGRSGKAHNLFLDDGLIALEDAEMGNLSKLEATRDSFYAAYREYHPEETRSGSAGVAGKFFRFVHEIQLDDLVVYPALPDKQVYIGVVTEKYRYARSSNYPHRRTVKWKYVIPKSDFSRSAVYELGAARTFFQFKKNVDELARMINDKSVIRFRAKSSTK